MKTEVDLNPYISDHIQTVVSRYRPDRRYKVQVLAITGHSGIFSYRGKRWYFYRDELERA